MRHEEIRRLLHIYLDGMLNERQRAEVESHLRTCEECKRELGYLRIVERGMETYPLLETPLHFAEDIISTLQTTPQSRYTLEPITTLLELPKFLFITIVASLREVANDSFLSIVWGIRTTKKSLVFALYSTVDKLKANFLNMKNHYIRSSLA